MSSHECKDIRLLLHTFGDDMEGGDYGHSLHHDGNSYLMAHLSTLSRKGYHVSRLATWTSVKSAADVPSAESVLCQNTAESLLPEFHTEYNFFDDSSSYHLSSIRVESSEWWCPFPTLHCYRSETTMSTARGCRRTRHLTRRGSSLRALHSYRSGCHCFRMLTRPYRLFRPSAWQFQCNRVLNTPCQSRPWR